MLFRVFYISKLNCVSYRKITMSKYIVNDLLQIFNSCISAVLPGKLINNVVHFDPKNDELSIAGESFSLVNKNVYVIGTGKAVQDMAIGVEKILGHKIKQGIISIPYGSLYDLTYDGNVIYYEGAKNNLPDANAQATATKVKNLVKNLSSDDILLVLISGGGSALLPLPKEPMILEEKTGIVRKLANAGADITELNTVRKKLSGLKGGQLAIMAQPALVISLILSDIVGDPLDLIASGPTTENKDHQNAAVDIMKKYNLYDQLPNSIKDILVEPNNFELFPKHKVKNFIIGSNKLSIDAAVNECKTLNYLAVPLSNAVTGNVKDIARKYVILSKMFCDFMDKFISKEDLRDQLLCLDIPGIYNYIHNISDLEITASHICLILGGEITVEVKGNGKGGRNQQLALEFSNKIYETKKNFQNFDVYLLSAGTDGIDGPTNAAGAIGYIDLKSDAKNDNIDIIKYLSNNDSYNFYKSFKKGLMHVITGHTNTNVMDIHIICIIKNKM